LERNPVVVTHPLSAADLRALVTGHGQVTVLPLLQRAELSKHQLLLAALMREAAQTRPAEYATTLLPAYQLLANIEEREPEVVRGLLASPQFGGWVSDCLRRLTAPADASHENGTPLATDLGQLAVIAATAALRTGRPFDVSVPLRHGTLMFPNLGTAYPGAASAWEWGRVRLDALGGRVMSSMSTVQIPAATDLPQSFEGDWLGIARLTTYASGLWFKIALDDRDPFLDRYGLDRASVTADGLANWQRLLDQAWNILARDHRPTATMIAAVVRALVPLARPARTRLVSSTAASAFGAIALSLPDDALTMAEVLVHEFQHSVLSAVLDVVPLIESGASLTTYAPWREDARPMGSLVHGLYAHLGVARFWCEQRGSGPAAEQLRADVEFARWRPLLTAATEELASAGVLTGYGREFLAAVRDVLASWQHETLPALAVEYGEDLSLDHRVRWRLRHLAPDSSAIHSLASAWRCGNPPENALLRLIQIRDCMPAPPASESLRSYLLGLRYRDPTRFSHWAQRQGEQTPDLRTDAADRALLAGSYASAARGYLRRIEAGDDIDAWAGLAIARRHTGPAGSARILADHPEVAAALQRRLRDDPRADPDRIVAWLSSPEPSPGQPAAAKAR
jgi:HEXXH motif-containing protein